MLTKLKIHNISLKTFRVPQGYSNMFTLNLGLKIIGGEARERLVRDGWR